MNPFKNKSPKLKNGGKIPDLSNMSFAQAFSKSREEGLGQFYWGQGDNKQIFGNALNTKQELGEYDKKYNTNMSNIFTGSGIAGETYSQTPQSASVPNTQVQSSISEDTQVKSNTQSTNTTGKKEVPTTQSFKKSSAPEWLVKSNQAKMQNLKDIKDRNYRQKGMVYNTNSGEYIPSHLSGKDEQTYLSLKQTLKRLDKTSPYYYPTLYQIEEMEKPKKEQGGKVVPKFQVGGKSLLTPEQRGYSTQADKPLSAYEFMPADENVEPLTFNAPTKEYNNVPIDYSKKDMFNTTPSGQQDIIGLNPTTKPSVNPFGNMSTYDKMFLGMNTLNTVKGFMGRGIKPPKRDLVDRQDIIGATKGMNQYAKDTALQGMSNQLNTASQLNKTIDPRLNTASMLGLQENLNNSAIQLNAQDSQMYDQDVNRQLGQRQNENLRMLGNEQRFNEMVDSEALQNYQAQQANAQQSINQGMQNYLTMARDRENKQAQQLANDQLTKATLYQNAVGGVQRQVSNINPNTDGTYSVNYYDDNGQMQTQSFPDINSASNFRNQAMFNKGVDVASLNQANKSYQGYNQFIKGFKNGGKTHYPNPFRSSDYTTEMLRQSSITERLNTQLRTKTSLKPKFR